MAESLSAKAVDAIRSFSCMPHGEPVLSALPHFSTHSTYPLLFLKADGFEITSLESESLWESARPVNNVASRVSSAILYVSRHISFSRSNRANMLIANSTDSLF